jgi:hypothetical protein
MMESGGFVENVDELKESLSFDGEYSDRETELWNISRTKDLVEVLEYWCFEDGRVYRTLIGNRKIVLRKKEASPFAHNQYPFFIANATPNFLSPWGTGDITLIAQLQDILWELMNHRLDNMELINNAILLIRSDIQDYEQFEYYPGARWRVDDPAAVQNFAPPYQLATLTLEAEALLKGDLQNVTAAAPFAGGTQSATVDQTTATGASLVMSAAQKRLMSKKYQAMQGMRREAWQRLKNCQQFIDEKRLVQIVGEDGALLFREIEPVAIQGEFSVELTPMGDAMNRQEKRAEAGQLIQILGQLAPLFAATGTPINMGEVGKWFLKKWDIVDYERFFSNPQGPAAAAAGMQGGQQGGGGEMPQPGGGLPGQENMGVTAASATDASSPSATGGLSLSGSQFLQRALAMGGGPANA